MCDGCMAWYDFDIDLCLDCNLDIPNEFKETEMFKAFKASKKELIRKN